MASSGSIGATYCKGVSLIELMVALALGLIITLGAGQLFLMGLQSFKRVEALAQRQESLRYVVDILSDDLRTAFNSLSQDPDKSDTAVNVADDGKSIRMQYFDNQVSLRGREEIPYCGDKDSDGKIDDLYYLDYIFDAGDLKISYQCGQVEGTSLKLDSATSPQPVIGGIGDVTFTRIGFATIGVELRFPPLGSDDNGEVFYFVVTNRAKALSRINTLLNNF